MRISVKLLTIASCAALAAVLGGCGGNAAVEDEPQEAPAPAVEPTPAPELEPERAEAPEPEEPEPTIPECCFTTHDGKIVDTAGNEIASSLNEEDANDTSSRKGKDETRMVGALAEDRILLARYTSQYDEEWHTEYDPQTHLLLADAKGNTIADLDDITAKYGSLEFSIEDHSPYFSDGRFALCLNYQGESNTVGFVTIVIDTEGREVFSIGNSANCTFPTEFGREGCSPFEYGHAYFSSLESILDVDGNIVAQGMDHFVTGMAGKDYNYYRHDGSGAYVVSDVWNNDGTAFDLKALSSDSISFNSSTGAVAKVLGGNVLQLEGTEANPHGGSSRDVSGLYNVAAGTWIVPLGPSQESHLIAYGSTENQIYVSAESEAYVLGAESNASDTADAKYACIMDGEGKVIFDMSMSGIEPYCQSDSYFRGQHVIGGYWLIQCGASGSTSYLIYFDENNKYIGAQPTTLTNTQLSLYGVVD